MTSDEASDADLRAAQPTPMVKLAAATQATSGLFAALCGIQITDIVFVRYPVLAALPYVLIVGGLLAIALATRVYRVRPIGAYAAAAWSAVLALILVGWFLYSFDLAFSCMLTITAPIALLTSVLAFVALGPVRTAARARERLAAQGMHLGT